MRVGMGYDVHRLVEDRPLILGGVEIPYEKGFEPRLGISSSLFGLQKKASIYNGFTAF